MLLTLKSFSFPLSSFLLFFFCFLRPVSHASRPFQKVTLWCWLSLRIIQSLQLVIMQHASVAVSAWNGW